jgi:hypothetical protein
MLLDFELIENLDSVSQWSEPILRFEYLRAMTTKSHSIKPNGV